MKIERFNRIQSYLADISYNALYPIPQLSTYIRTGSCVH